MSKSPEASYYDPAAPNKRGYRFNPITLGRNALIAVGIYFVAKSAIGAGGEVIQNAQDIFSGDSNPRIEQAFSDYASENLISSELIAVNVKSGDTVEGLCKSNMVCEDENQPNWGEFTNYVKNLNKELFANGRILQPGDVLYIPASYGKAKESPSE